MLPQGLEKRRQYNELIERGVQLLREIDQLKEDLGQLKEEAEEGFGKDLAKQYPKMVKIRHSTGKVQQKAESDLDLVAECEILQTSKLEHLIEESNV